jgi:hypothetical protein
LAAFFLERPPADVFAMRALLPVGHPTVNAKPRRPCSSRPGTARPGRE